MFWPFGNWTGSPALHDVLMLMERLGEAKGGSRSLTEAIDTTSAADRMTMQMVGAFAEFERAMLRKRTRAGLVAAREEGRGRRPKLSDKHAPSWKTMHLQPLKISLAS